MSKVNLPLQFNYHKPCSYVITKYEKNHLQYVPQGTLLLFISSRETRQTNGNTHTRRHTHIQRILKKDTGQLHVGQCACLVQ